MRLLILILLFSFISCNKQKPLPWLSPVEDFSIIYFSSEMDLEKMIVLRLSKNCVKFNLSEAEAKDVEGLAIEDWAYLLETKETSFSTIALVLSIYQEDILYIDRESFEEVVLRNKPEYIAKCLKLLNSQEIKIPDLLFIK